MSNSVRLTVTGHSVPGEPVCGAGRKQERLIAGASESSGTATSQVSGRHFSRTSDPEPDGGSMPYIMPRNDQGMVNAAAAYAKAKERRQTWMCTASIGPGSLNMVTGAAVATTNRLPVLLFPSDQFATRYPEPVLQQIEDPVSPLTAATDAFRPVSRYFDRSNDPNSLFPP